MVLSFENNGEIASYTKYNLPLVEIKDFNVVIDGQNFFDQPVENNLMTHDDIRMITTDQEIITQLVLY